VVNVDSSSRELEVRLTGLEELDAQVVDQEVAAPAVVVAAHHDDANATLPRVVQGTERLEGLPRDHVPILEPKVEQVPDDEEVVARFRYRREKAVEGPLDICPGCAEVQVADDQGAWGGHGAR